MLPKIDVPVYETILPSNNQVIKFRPFLVKEQKILMMGAQASDPKDIIDSIRQILSNCILSDIDIESLPVFDLEFLFLNLRARSINEVVEIKYRCNNDLSSDKEDKEELKKCTGFVTFNINVLDIKPEFGEGHTSDIKLSEKVGMKLKYPTFEMMKDLDTEGKSEDDVMYDLLVGCIDFIYDENNMYYPKDSTKEEIGEFIDNLQQKNLEQIKTFFGTMPKVKKELDFVCPKCGFEDHIILEGVQNFFE